MNNRKSGITVEEKGMAHSIEMTSIDDQIIPDEIEEGRKVHHLIDLIKDANGQDPSGSQTNKFGNQFFDEAFEDYLNNPSTKSCTIFKVNVWLRESKPDAYTPKMLFIGPYHKKNSHLDPMKSYKLSYLLRFLRRKDGLNVESCIRELEKLEEEALKCYDHVETDNFCEMLLLDGCFVIEFIRECCGIYPKGEEVKIINNVCHIWRDLMLLENQLPFFVLNKLHEMTKRDAESPLGMLVSDSLPFFADLPKMTPESFTKTAGCYNINHLLHLVHILSCHGNSKKKSENNDEETGGCYNIKHLLHCVHRLSCHGNRKKKSENNDDPMWHKVMPNATELSEAGVSFAKVSNINSNTSLFAIKFEHGYGWKTSYPYPVRSSFAKDRDNFTSLFDIKFENGLMKIPCFRVEDLTETLLRNLIAYEQQSCDVNPRYFSDYATFIDHLIDSDKDVNLLRQKGIIVNFIGEDKEVASLFNKIGSGVTMYPNFYYKEEFRKAVEHCEKPWNRMKANLMHNYFNTPWAGASTVAAIVLLILTTIQTILAFTGSIKQVVIVSILVLMSL